jgi:hypothetical protein
MNYFLYNYPSRALRFPAMSENELSTAQVAARMKVSVHTVRWWCRNGLLPNAYEAQESRGAVWKIPEGALTDFQPPKKTGRPRTAKPEASQGTEKKPRKRAKKR